MEIIGPFILTIISGLSTMIGIIPIYLKINKVGELITFTLSLSYFILLSISLYDLIPNSLSTIFKYYNITTSIFSSIIIFLIGYMIIYLLKIKKETNSLYKIGIISLISLVLHNIPEGIIVFMSSYKNIKFGLKTFIAIICHNIPEGLLIGVPLYYSKQSRDTVIKNVLLASISEPLGALLSFLFLKRVMNDILLSYILIFVAGLMISLCINDIYKELLIYNNKKYILLGFLVSMIFLTIMIIL
jgi:ZIP family zinc transporter